jgi:hypothetical protein
MDAPKPVVKRRYPGCSVALRLEKTPQAFPPPDPETALKGKRQQLKTFDLENL